MEGAEKEGSLEKKTKSGLDNQPGATAEAASLFTDDLILEILSRLPARSVHRFKCVSVPWRNLIVDPANRKKLPHTFAGFLYMTVSNNGVNHHFTGNSGAVAPFDPSLSCLQPNKDEGIYQVNTCNGLLLYRHYNKNKVVPWTVDDSHFVVCNPASGRWVELPPEPQTQEPVSRVNQTAGLAFDPAVSSHFHVLCFERTFPGTFITGVNIYLSRAGAWSRRDSGMVEKATLSRSKSVFVGGMLYIMGNLEGIRGEYVLVGVDMEGKVWKTIRVPYGSKFGTIGSSQGCLHYVIAHVDNNNEILVSEIALWCLKDCDSKELVLKHTASIDKLMSTTGLEYRVVEIHPERDTIFLVSHGGDTLVAYDMQHQKVGCILNLEKDNIQQFLHYVPLFSEPLADADGQ